MDHVNKSAGKSHHRGSDDVQGKRSPICIFFFFVFFLGLHLQHMEVPMSQKLQKPWQRKETNGAQMWQSKIYSAPRQALGSHFQSLSTRSLFSATFIPYGILFFPCKQPRTTPSQSRQHSCLRNRASKDTGARLGALLAGLLTWT